jgi:hypothetical protein
MARLYRLTINNKVKTADAARLVYILREVRTAIEAEPAAPPAAQPTTLRLVEIPSGQYIRELSELSGNPQLTIEHRIEPSPAPEQIEREIEEAEPVVEIEPEPELATTARQARDEPDVGVHYYSLQPLKRRQRPPWG